MRAPPIVLAVDRETTMIAALAALIVAGLVVALGAVVLLVRERRLRASWGGREKDVASGGVEAIATPSPAPPLGASGEAPSPPGSREASP